MNPFDAPPWGRWELDELRRLTAAGWADGRIGRHLGRTPKAVAQRRRLLGLRKHGRVRRRVARLLAAGYATWEIAARLGRSESAVRAAGRTGR